VKLRLTRIVERVVRRFVGVPAQSFLRSAAHCTRAQWSGDLRSAEARLAVMRAPVLGRPILRTPVASECDATHPWSAGQCEGLVLEVSYS